MITISPKNEFQLRALAEKAAREQKRPKKVAPPAKAAREKRKACLIYSADELMHRAILRRFQVRAEKKGWEFDLTAEWLVEKLKTTHCEATGILFSGARNAPFGLTFDRRDNSKGYTMENVWVTCWIYNRCKLNGTHEDVMVLARALVETNQSS